MALKDWFSWISQAPIKGISPQRVALSTSPETKPLPAGRASFDSESTIQTSNWLIFPPQDYESHWRLMNLDVAHLDRHTPKELIDMLADLSPELSRAIWDVERLCNPGWEYRIYNLGDDDVINVEGKAHVDNFFERLRKEYGSVDIVLGRFFMGAYLRGGFCAELVLDGEARDSIDLVAPDPYSVRFRKRIDPLRKEVWQPGQWQGTEFKPLDIPTFKYLPVDPAPASPYGRPLAAPALFTLIFLLALLHDVRRVVMQQGYKRMDIVLNSQMAEDSFNFDSQGFANVGAYMRGAIDAVREAYRRLKPDDAFIHTDLFTLNPPAGTIDSDSISAIAQIIEKLEKMAARALKSTSLIMESGANPNENDSNRRWEIHAAGIKSLQHLCENMLESLLLVSLQAVGIQARVQFRFSELRASEMLRDEQTRQMRLQNNVGEYQAGFVSQNEASNNQVGHDADEQEPRAPVEAEGLTEGNGDGSESLNKNEDDRALREMVADIISTLERIEKTEYTFPQVNGKVANGTH